MDILNGSKNEDIRRGILCLEEQDIATALSIFTEVLESGESDAETKAESLFYRGMANYMSGDIAGAITDWFAVQQIPGVSEETAEYVRQKSSELLASAATDPDRAPSESDVTTAMVEQYLPTLDKPDADPFEKWFAGSFLMKHGELQGEKLERAHAMVDENRPPLSRHVDKSLFEGGTNFLNEHLYPMAIIMFDELCREDRPSSKYKVKGLSHRGMIRMNMGDTEGAKADWRAVLATKGAPREELSSARVALVRAESIERIEVGNAHLEAGQTAKAIACYESVLNNPEAHEFDKMMAAGPLMEMEDLPVGLKEKAQSALAVLEDPAQNSPLDLASARNAASPRMPLWKRAFLGTLSGGVLGIIFAVVVNWYASTSDWVRETPDSATLGEMILMLGGAGAISVGFAATITHFQIRPNE